MTTQTLLKERGGTHGDFTDNANVAQAIKNALHGGKYWHNLTEIEREALDMIAHKMARAVSAPKYHDDNYKDIAGYATLVVERL